MPTSKNAYLEFHFATGESPTLSRTVFYAPSNGEPLIGVRTSSATRPLCPFKWTPTTHAVAILVVKAALLSTRSAAVTTPLLEGRNGTPAYNIGKLVRLKANPWLLDLFGSDPFGTSLFQRVFLCSNYKLSCASPIQIYLRKGFLSPENIRIFLEGSEVSGQRAELQKLCRALELAWKPGNNGTNVTAKNASKSAVGGRTTKSGTTGKESQLEAA